MQHNRIQNPYNAGSMQIRRIDSDDAHAWNEYVAANPKSSLYHRYEWRDFYADYFGKETEYFVAADCAGRLTGVLPLVRLKSWLFGDFYVSLPFVNYGGVVADERLIAEELMAAAASLGRARGVTHIEFRHANREFDLPCRTDKVAMLLDLPLSVEKLGQSIGSKRRSQIKRPLREDPDVRFGGLELLDSFYSVFARNMRDLGTPCYAKSMFGFLLEKFPETTKLVTISVRRQPAAAAFLIFDDDRMEIPWASTVRDFNRISINMLLYWRVLTYAIETGKEKFDFGRSTKDSGAYRFKKQWGAKALPLNWHYWLANDGKTPNLSPDNSKFRFLIQAWQKLPLPVANFLGPRIVRHLP